MSKPRILQEGQSYTFRSYFEMPYDTDEIVAEFGYAFEVGNLQLPTSTHHSDRIGFIREQIEDILPYVRLSSETARREVLVAPILIELTRFLRCQMRIEYPLAVSNWLKGDLDYLLRSAQSLVVIEAKRDDLTRGFTQLAVEMIALAQAEEREVIYGAVTIGNVWVFGQLDRTQQRITQGLQLYTVPDDIDALLSVLIGILEG